MHLHTCRFVCVHERECVNNDILVYVRHTYTQDIVFDTRTHVCI